MEYVIGIYLLIGIAAALVGKEQLEEVHPLVKVALKKDLGLFLVIFVFLMVCWPMVFTLEPDEKE